MAGMLHSPLLPWPCILLVFLSSAAAASYFSRSTDGDRSGSLMNNYWTYETMLPVPSMPAREPIVQESDTEMSLLLRMLGKFNKRGNTDYPENYARPPPSLLYAGDPVYRGTADAEMPTYVSKTPASPYKSPSNIYHGRIALNEQSNVAYLVIRCSEQDRPECYEWLRQRFHQGNPSSSASTWLYKQLVRSPPREVSPPWGNRLPVVIPPQAIYDDRPQGPPALEQPQKRRGTISIDTALRVIPVTRYSTPAERKAASQSRLETLGRK